MKKAVIFILACAPLLQLALICNCTHGFTRQKRGVLDMVATLWCYRERLKVPLFGINLYGCYCGTGGSGVAVDAVDRCCFLHDCCYYHSRVSLKCHSKVKWQLYHFSCDGSQTRCTSSGVCGRMACECDKQFAECLTRARPRRKHFFYNRRDLCPGIKDTCPAGFPNVTEILHWTHNPSHSQVMVTGPSENQEDHRKVKTNEQDKPGTEGQGF